MFSFFLIKKTNIIHCKTSYANTSISSKLISGLWLHIYLEQRPYICQANNLQLLVQGHWQAPIKGYITTLRATHTDAASEPVCSPHDWTAACATRIQATLTSMRAKDLYLWGSLRGLKAYNTPIESHHPRILAAFFLIKYNSIEVNFKLATLLGLTKKQNNLFLEAYRRML